jgi:DNA-directed RNA polymerase specialized sigma subunit
MARIYLAGKNTSQIAKRLGVTQERAAQLVRRGIAYMWDSGWLSHAQSGPGGGAD